MNAEQKDIRWEHQFSEYRKALAKLTNAITIFEIGEEVNLESEEIDNLLKEGLIQRFEYTHELAWNLMRAYAGYLGNNTVKGPKDAIREGLKLGLITEAHEWMSMISARNEILQMYNKNSVNDIFLKILESYYLLFSKFEQTMEGLQSGMSV